MWKAVLDRVTIQLLSRRLLCDWNSGWLKKTKTTSYKKKKKEKGGVCAKVTGLTVTAEHLPGTLTVSTEHRPGLQCSYHDDNTS